MIEDCFNNAIEHICFMSPGFQLTTEGMSTRLNVVGGQLVEITTHDDIDMENILSLVSLVKTLTMFWSCFSVF